MKNSRINFSQMMKLSSEFKAIVQWWNEYSSKSGFTDNRQRGNIILKHSFFVSCRELSSLSLNEIGQIINKDHATVLHAMKQHKNNIAYLPTYQDVYEEIYHGIKKALAIKGIHREVENIHDVRELRFRLVNTSERLRMKILEVNDLKKRVDDAPEKLKQENAFLKKHSGQIYERNKRLESELARLKNLI
jgi:hypothetical protein